MQSCNHDSWEPFEPIKVVLHGLGSHLTLWWHPLNFYLQEGAFLPFRSTELKHSQNSILIQIIDPTVSRFQIYLSVPPVPVSLKYLVHHCQKSWIIAVKIGRRRSEKMENELGDATNLRLNATAFSVSNELEELLRQETMKHLTEAWKAQRRLVRACTQVDQQNGSGGNEDSTSMDVNWGPEMCSFWIFRAITRRTECVSTILRLEEKFNFFYIILS